MNYDEFRRAWDEALLGSSVLSHGDRPEERIELASMDRSYRVRVGLFAGQPADPFLASMEMKWRWGALTSARMRTVEEDVLSELLGPGEIEGVMTDRPRLRVDIALDGKLPSSTPMRLPNPEAFRVWLEEVSRLVDPTLPPSSEPSDDLSIESWRGEPEAQVRFGPDGEPWLLGVGLTAWQAIYLPRQWDDPEHGDASPRLQLEAFAKRLRAARSVWARCLKALFPTVDPSDPGLH